MLLLVTQGQMFHSLEIAHRQAPIRDGALWVALGDIRKGTPRFVVPERVEKAHALVEFGADRGGAGVLEVHLAQGLGTFGAVVVGARRGAEQEGVRDDGGS